MADDDWLEDLSGRWCGFWTQPTDSGFHRMELTLRFARGNVSGEGKDEIGPFTIAGRYQLASGQCSWEKRYPYHTIDYQGVAQTSTIAGRWSHRGSPACWSGDFKLWPEGAAGLAEEFFITETQPESAPVERVRETFPTMTARTIADTPPLPMQFRI